MMTPSVPRPVLGSCEGLVVGVGSATSGAPAGSAAIVTEEVPSVGAASTIPANPTTLTVAIAAAAMS